MTVTDEIIHQICNVEGTENFKEKVFIILQQYEIKEKTYEIVPYTGDKNTQLLKKFIVAKTIKGLTKRSIDYYTAEMKRFFRDIDKDVTTVTQDDIKLLIAGKKILTNVTDTTINNSIRAWSSFFSFLHEEEIITKNPMMKVEKIKERKKQKEAFTEVEIERMRDKLENLRDKAIFETLLSTWCRVSEVESIKIEDIKKDGSIKIIGKGEKERTVYLNNKALFAIDKYLSSRTDNNEYLFVSLDLPNDRLKKSRIEEVIRKLGRSVGCVAYPHKFRRTGATFALRAGMPIEHVSKLLGHEDISTTQIYLDISQENIQMDHRKYAKY